MAKRCVICCCRPVSIRSGSTSGTILATSSSITINDTSLTPRSFNISPAYSGYSTWNLNVDGPLSFSTAGTWTITPTVNFTATVKAWGAGGGGGYPSRSEAAHGAAGGVALTGIRVLG